MKTLLNFETVAKQLSIILGPHLWLPIILIASVFKTGLTSHQIIILLPLLFILQFLIPASYLLLAVKLKKSSSWDLPLRKERYPFLLLTSSIFLVSLLLVYRFGNQLLFHLQIIEVSLLFLLSIITRFWKISLHLSLNTAGSILINFLFGWQLPFLFLSIPIIAWARYYLKRHTVAQLLGGILVSALWTTFLLSYFKYI